MLEVKNINYFAEEKGVKKHILKDITFSLNDGDNFVITGHNGSGKSTLLKILMGIYKPTSGSVIFNGQDVTNLSIDEHARIGMAFSFQTPVTFKGLTVRKMLELASNNSGKFSDYCDTLSKLGLCAREYLDRELNNKLSGGEQKRIEIASVLVRNAKLNLFDEPEAGIDIWSFDNLVEIFNTTKSANIIVSHQRRLIEQADKIMLLSNGKIEQFDVKEKVLDKINENNSCSKLNKKNS